MQILLPGRGERLRLHRMLLLSPQPGMLPGQACLLSRLQPPQAIGRQQQAVQPTGLALTGRL